MQLLQSRLFANTVHLAPAEQVLFLNSAADPFVCSVAQCLVAGTLILAEDNLAALHSAMQELRSHPSCTVRSVAFHEYTLWEPPATMNVAILNLLYQPNNAWMYYALELAGYALKAGGRLYVGGAKERGIITLAKRMATLFGNVETLAISKGQRVVSSLITSNWRQRAPFVPLSSPELVLSNEDIFAQGKVDEGTNLLLKALEVRPADEALDIGCGAGYLGLHIARLASQGQVTMLDGSLFAVSVARGNVATSGLTNIHVLPSNGAQAVRQQRFDLVVTNPPFHQGGMQTSTIAERFIREAAAILRPRGRFYLVANRFLKYEPTLRECFETVIEVGGNTRFKVLRATSPRKPH